MRVLALSFLSLAVLSALSACGDGPPASADRAEVDEPAVEAATSDTARADAPQSSGDTSRARPIAPGSRPETATSPIQIEGTDESIDLRLVTVEDVPLPFSTYVPADWADDVLGSGEGTGARFSMGTPSREGVVTVFVPSEPNRAGVEDLARTVAESNGGAEPLGAAEPWVRSGYRFADGDRVGSVRVGEHADVPFYVLVQYPIEMGDGFAPRVALVLDRLRWSDDGTAL